MSLQCWIHRTVRSLMLVLSLLAIVLYLTIVKQDQLLLLHPAPSLSYYGSLPPQDISDREIFQNLLLGGNMSKLTEKEFNFFIEYKENQYKERRENVQEVCRDNPSDFSKQILKNSLVVDKRDGVAYCQIAKVASSTFCNHFIQLGTAAPPPTSDQ